MKIIIGILLTITGFLIGLDLFSNLIGIAILEEKTSWIMVAYCSLIVFISFLQHFQNKKNKKSS